MEYFGSLQLGIGRSNGAEAIIHAVNYVYQNNTVEDTVLMKIDLSNAFNNIDRNIVLREVVKIFPTIAPWVQYSYGCAPYLFTGSSDIIRSAVGVQQGDPMAPLLFCLALHPVLLEIQNHPDCSTLSLNTWYMDDGTLIGPSKGVRTALDLISTLGPSHGIFVNTKKCELFPLSIETDLSIFPNAIPVSVNGVELLGSYIGDSNSCEIYVDKRVTIIADIVAQLSSLEIVQHQYALLKNCILMPKFMFILRTFQPDSIAHSIGMFDTLVATSISSLLGSCTIEPFQYNRLTLPIALSGSGILLAESTMRPAYLGSALQCLSLQSTLLNLNEDVLSADLFQKVNNYLLSIESTLTLNKLFSNKNPQSLLSESFYKYIYNNLLSNAPCPSIDIYCKLSPLIVETG
jgi:hypothetical protein